jgi:hypothetical protein
MSSTVEHWSLGLGEQAGSISGARSSPGPLLSHERDDTLCYSGAGFCTKLAEDEWIEGPYIQICRIGVGDIRSVHLLRIEPEVLQIDAFDERAIGEDALIREHDRVDIRHDVASQLP